MSEQNNQTVQRTRNASPIVKLLNTLAEEKFIDWSTEKVTFVAEIEGKNKTIKVAIDQFVGNFTLGNLTTLSNKYNVKPPEARKFLAMARQLRELGMNDAADDLVKKAQEVEEKAKEAAKTA